MTKSRLFMSALLAVAILAGCGAGRNVSSAGHPAVAQLRSIAQLRHTFDAHAGVPRLILLISPT